MYGNMYGEHVMERVRRAAEFCDSLQSFFIMHSLGGGTGSGLGSRVITLLHDNFPGVYRYNYYDIYDIIYACIYFGH